MDLTIHDVAELLRVSESTVRRWISEKNLPAYRLQQHYHFNSEAVEQWMTKNRYPRDGEISAHDSSSDAEKAPTKQGALQFSLYRALHRGFVLSNLHPKTKQEAIAQVVAKLAVPLDFDPQTASELFFNREKLHSTAVGGGYAIPHARDLLGHRSYDSIAVAYLNEPIPYDSFDGEPVHTLFFLFAANSRHHLHLLAKLAHLLHDETLSELLMHRADKPTLLKAVRSWEGSLTRTTAKSEKKIVAL